jgi:hypothetical protein
VATEREVILETDCNFTIMSVPKRFVSGLPIEAGLAWVMIAPDRRRNGIPGGHRAE